jgi:hypothetical protein
MRFRFWNRPADIALRRIKRRRFLFAGNDRTDLRKAYAPIRNIRAALQARCLRRPMDAAYPGIAPAEKTSAPLPM